MSTAESEDDEDPNFKVSYNQQFHNFNCHAQNCKQKIDFSFGLVFKSYQKEALQ